MGFRKPRITLTSNIDTYSFDLHILFVKTTKNRLCSYSIPVQRKGGSPSSK